MINEKFNESPNTIKKNLFPISFKPITVITVIKTKKKNKRL